jgi:integrase
LAVGAIETDHVLRVLQQEVEHKGGRAQLWQAKSETASRLRGRMENILDWAAFRGYRQGDNPARWKGHLTYELPAKSKLQKTEHHASLPYREVGGFMEELRKRPGITARALEFSILTASRSGEVRGATWEEINLADAVWTIPAERMKAGSEHTVPLSPETLGLLQSLHSHRR